MSSGTLSGQIFIATGVVWKCMGLPVPVLLCCSDVCVCVHVCVRTCVRAYMCETCYWCDNNSVYEADVYYLCKHECLFCLLIQLV